MIKSLTNLQYQLGSWVKFRLDTVSKTRGSARVMVGLITASVTAAVVAIFYAQICEFAFERAIKLSEERPLLFVLLAPIFFGLSSYLVLKFSREAGGSGIPRLLHEIEKPPEHEQQSARIVRLIKLIFIKIISSVSGLLGGGIVGREGPTIQIAATIFDLLDTTFHGYFSKRVSRQSLLIAGGSAGLAAAFNTPIGGVVFAVEELSKGHVRTFKGTLILAVITAGYITQAAIGPYLFIGHPNIGAVTLRDTVTGSIMAAGIGLCGASFGLILFKLAKYLDTWRLKQRLILACACGLTAGLVCLWLGPNASGGGGALIRQLLFVNSQDQIILGPILAIWRVLGMIVTYISGGAAGIFAPSLAAGSALAAMVVQWFHFHNSNLIIVMGMVSFLTGVTRSPLTAFILVFEMTDRQSAVIQLLLSAFIANTVAQLVDEKSFYENMAHTFAPRKGEDDAGEQFHSPLNHNK